MERMSYTVGDLIHEEEAMRKYTPLIMPIRFMTPEQVRERRKRFNSISRIKRTYGLAPDEHAKFIKKHRKRCGICKSTSDLCIDHDHTTKELRGLLCKPCNRALGTFKDSIKLLRAAIAYLERNK